MTERITAAAIKHPSGTVYSVPAPGRHHNVIALMVKERTGQVMQSAQGFITSTGRFVDRVEARAIATQAGQLLDRDGGLPQLYSEDVW